MKNLVKFALAAATTAALAFTACTSDPCKDIECKNSGTCLDGTCSCPVGYEGTLCDTLSRTKFLGASGIAATYTVVDYSTAPVDTLQYSTIVSPATDPTKVVITSFLGLTCSGSPLVITVPINKKTFTVNETAFTCGSNTLNIQATGTIAGNIVTVDYDIKEGSTQYAKGKAVMTRQ